MRNLTITRTKSIVASLITMKVYIEDPDNSELLINGVPCRKLGKLKNGQTATFPISEQAAKVFVIADKASRNYSNDYYPLSEGTEDVSLSGKNSLRPTAGNPFLFDGVTDPEVLANRKRGRRKGSFILVAALLLGILVGIAGPLRFNVSTVDTKAFSVEGMTITLTTAFEEQNYQGFTRCYESSYVAVLTLKEEFTLMEGLEDYTLEDYGYLVLESNGMRDVALKNEQGILYFDYINQGGDGADYYYMATLHKSGDAFWLIQFSTPVTNETKLHDQFLTWAASVEFE